MLRRIWYALGQITVWLAASVLYRVRLGYQVPLPAGPKILAINHPSTLDPILVSLLTDERMCILIKDTLFKVPVVGWSLRRCGHIPVIAGQGQAALDAALERLKKGDTVVIFPEGDISPDNGFLAPRSGIGRLALASGAPVIPVGIALRPSRLKRTVSRVDGADEVGTWYLPGPYAMTVGESVRYQGAAQDRQRVAQVCSDVMERIATLALDGQAWVGQLPSTSELAARQPAALFQTLS